MAPIRTEFQFDMEEDGTGNFRRKITVRRDHSDPEHDRKHNEEVEKLISSLGIPRESADGKVKIIWEEITDAQAQDEIKIQKQNKIPPTPIRKEPVISRQRRQQ